MRKLKRQKRQTTNSHTETLRHGEKLLKLIQKNKKEHKPRNTRNMRKLKRQKEQTINLHTETLRHGEKQSLNIIKVFKYMIDSIIREVCFQVTYSIFFFLFF